MVLLYPSTDTVFLVTGYKTNGKFYLAWQKLLEGMRKSELRKNKL